MTASTLSSATSAPLSEGTGLSLKKRLARSERRRKLQAALLVAPLLLFILFTFAAPIGKLLWRAVHSPEVAEGLPKTAQMIQAWDGKSVPEEAVFVALAQDLDTAYAEQRLAVPAKRLNYDSPGMLSLLMKAGRKVASFESENLRQQFIDADPRWGEVETWRVIRNASSSYTDFFLLHALDLTRSASGEIVSVSDDEAIHLDILYRTFWISALVTAACLALSYPLAWLLANLPAKTANLLMICVLLPFWTSLLVRTTAWIVLLQNNGVVNQVMQLMGLFDAPVQLIFNRFGVVVAMTHVLLPFMILPLYSVMKSIPPVYARAAASLGANPWTVFWKVYVPQTLPGVGAGCLLVFIMAVGYYITPALVGGPRDQMLSYFVALHTNETLNWSMAAALAAVLFAATLVLYAIYSRLVGVNNMKLG